MLHLLKAMQSLGLIESLQKILWSSTSFSGGVCKSSSSPLPNQQCTESGHCGWTSFCQSMSNRLESEKLAVKMETVGAIINNANLAFLHPLSQVEHLILSPRYQPLWQQGRAERHWEQGEQKPLHLQHGNWARGRDTCIPLQDSQLCLLLLEICPKWLTWVYSNLSPAPHCSLLHSGLSKLNAFRNAIISCAFWGQGQYGYYHLEQEALFGSIKHRRVK